LFFGEKGVDVHECSFDQLGSIHAYFSREVEQVLFDVCSLRVNRSFFEEAGFDAGFA
jgi:hypothetical protein